MKGNDEDVMDLLRDADPARHAGPSSLGSTDALRENILATPRPQRPTRRRLRAGVVGVGALALAGAGVASYAAYDSANWDGGRATTSLFCGDVLTMDASDPAHRIVQGPPVTADPVADCGTYREQAGYPAIADPVAVDFNGYTWVVPRAAAADSPGGGAAPAAPPLDPAELALSDQLGDVVDGGESACYNRDSAPAFAEQAIAEAGLDGWAFRMGSDNRPYEEGPCGFFSLLPAERLVVFSPDLERTVTPGGEVATLATTLREAIKDQCLTLDEAQVVVAQALGDRHHWPTGVIEVPDQECTTVDLIVGGSLQVRLRGPLSPGA